MNIPRTKVLAWGLFLLAACSCLGVAADAEADENKQDQHQLSISLWKEQHVVGEPLVVRLQLVNTSESTIRAGYANEAFLRSSDITFFLTQVAGGATIEQYHMGPDVGLSQGELKAGKAVQEDMIVLPADLPRKVNQHVTLLPPGHYKLAAQVYTDRTLKSEPVDLVLTAAQGAAAEAADLMPSKRMYAFYAGEVMTLPAVRKLMRQYPDTPHARLARVRLLLNQARELSSQRPGRDRAKRERHFRFIDMLEEWVEDHKDHPLADNMLLAVAELYRSIGTEAEDAKNTLERITRDYPDGDVRREAAQLLEKMQRRAEQQRLFER